MEHWIAVAASTDGWFSFDMYGDFGNTDTPAADYVEAKTQYFYIVALNQTARIARAVGQMADAQRYGNLTAAAASAFFDRLYTADGCFGNCSYPSQIFGLSLLGLPGSERVDADAAWGHVLAQIGPNASIAARANRFGGGIVTLKLVWPLFQRFDAAGLALRTLLHTDHSPSLGFMTTNDGTTLHEAWSMAGAYDGTWVGSFNHAMMGSPGRWFFTLFAGIDRMPDVPSAVSGQPQNWQHVRIAPPRGADVWAQMTQCAASLAQPLGRIAVAWKVDPTASSATALFCLNATVPTNSIASVIVPTVARAGTVSLRESGTVVWNASGFHPGVTGIQSASLLDDTAIIMQVGSGTYTFVVTA
jgi:hypothetical protein